MAKLFGKEIRWPPIRVESRALKYGYANARARAVKGVLLSHSALEELVRVRSLSAMVELLERTPYRQDLVDLSIAQKDTALIEAATARRFARIAQKLTKAAPADDRPFIEALLLRWDLLMLRTALHAKRAGKQAKDLPDLLTITPGFQRMVRTLLEAEDGYAAFRKTGIGAQALATSTRQMNKEMLRRFREAGIRQDNTTQIELALDAYAYTAVNEALTHGSGDVQRIRRILQKEIDVRNIVTIERLKKRGVETAKIEAHMLLGGTLNMHTVARLVAAKNAEETRGILKSSWGPFVWEEETPVGLEIALEKALAQEKVKAFHRSILSLGTLMGAILILEEEVHNIRKIAKAKTFGLSEEEVTKTLVTVNA